MIPQYQLSLAIKILNNFLILYYVERPREEQRAAEEEQTEGRGRKKEMRMLQVDLG